jgi:hypothetical protein
MRPLLLADSVHEGKGGVCDPFASVTLPHADRAERPVGLP